MDRHNDTFSQIADSIKGEAALRTQELSEAQKHVLDMSDDELDAIESLDELEERIRLKSKREIKEDQNIPDSDEFVEKVIDEAVEETEEIEEKSETVDVDTEADYIPEIPEGGTLVGSIVDESVMDPVVLEIPKRKFNIKKLGFGILIPLFLLILVYAGGVIYFSNHYEPHTFIGAIDCSMMTKQESAGALENGISSFEIFLAGREGINSTILAKDIAAECVYDKDGLDKSLNMQTALAWPLHCVIGREIVIPTQVNYDSELLMEKIDSAPIMDSRIARKPENAKLGYSEVTQAIEIVPEDRGCLPDAEAIFNVVSQALTNLEAGQKQLLVNLDENNCYVEPEITSEDDNLNRVVKEADAMARTRVVYDWNGAEVIVDGSNIAQWIKCEGSKVLLDEEKVARFVEDTANTYDTYNQPFSFRTTSGKRISIERHEYGWRTDVEAETAALIEHIKNCDRIDKEPAYAYKGYAQGLDDIGTSYVEIDLSSQHLYLYQDGVITLETDFVSGGPPNGEYTPDGIYGITYKTTNAVLRGPGYETPVTYWMPFNGGIGMHDAYWRNEFGGEVYKRSGSHGCVNLPPQAAKTVYDAVCPNFPVVCYW